MINTSINNFIWAIQSSLINLLNLKRFDINDFYNFKSNIIDSPLGNISKSI